MACASRTRRPRLSCAAPPESCGCRTDRKSTRLNSCHTVIYTLSLHDALPIYRDDVGMRDAGHGLRLAHQAAAALLRGAAGVVRLQDRSEEHTSELLSHSDLHSFPTRRSSDLP